MATVTGSKKIQDLSLDSLTVDGNIAVTGTVDGRDIATDGTKLDGIASNANNYSHPTHPGDDINLDTGPLTGATVVSDIDINVTTDTLGHVTDANATYSTRNLTYSDVGAAAASHSHSYLPLSGGTLTGALTINSATPTINFNGTSDAGVDMAIKATPEGLDFYEPEDTDKIHFQILDDQGVNSPFGYQWNGQSLDARYQAKGTYNTIIGTDSDINTSGSTIIDNIYVTDGVITSMGTRTLTASDLSAYTSAQTDSAITSAINGLVDGAPAALNTLNELAAAIGDNAGYAASITTALASKVATNSAQALRPTDALTVSNDTITIHKGDGTSESVTISDAYENYGQWNIAASGTSGTSAITSGNTVTFSGTGATTVTRSGDNIVINSVNTDTNTWRPIHDSPVDGATTTSISSNWAFDNVKTAVPAGAKFTDTVYTHPSYAGDDINLDTGALSGATVISDLDFNVTTDTLGHVTDANATYSTRNLTAADVGAAAASHTHSYLPLSGGTLTGALAANAGISQDGFTILNGSDTWLRTNGQTGWYSATYGGGWYMTDSTYVRTYNNKSIYTAGEVLAGGNVTAYSDRRLKTNIEVIPDALAKVSTLSGYTFDRVDINTARQTGVIAQEVQAVLPEAVTEDENGTLAVSYGNVVGLLIEAIKELTKRVKELEGR